MRFSFLLLGILSFPALACEAPLLSDGRGNCLNPADFPGTTVQNCQGPFKLFENRCQHENIVNRLIANRAAAAEATRQRLAAETAVVPPTETTVVPPTETAVVPPTETTVVPPTETAVVPPTETPVVPPTNPQSSQESLADTFASYDPATCEWTPDLPRKLHSAPGCTRSTKNQICVGYVVCNAKSGEGKFVRTATCGADKCGSPEAVACVNDRAHYSSKPEESVGRYMSDRVKTQVIGQ